ncbi:MAG: hypothetical protein HOO98_13785 [Nitrospira sp.]|nr:hypothetical protein [Nitrospira sp.]
MKRTIPFKLVSVLAICLMSLSGCSTASLSGAGTMRIDVEVYKGPLSLEPDIQWGALIGYLREAERVLEENLEFTRSVVAYIGVGCPATGSSSEACADKSNSTLLDNSSISGRSLVDEHQPPVGRTGVEERPFPSWCDKFNTPWYVPPFFFKSMTYFDCLILRSTYVANDKLLKEVRTILAAYEATLSDSALPHSKRVEVILQDIAKFSSMLLVRSNDRAVGMTAGQSFSLAVRIAYLNFVVRISELGNQLQARADTYRKQLDPESKDRRELPLSSYLRDTEPSDFVHLYDWAGVSTDSFRYKVLSWLFSGHWPASIEERVKIVERLYTDRFWSRINTVYTSGRGKTNTAFVKDEVGNWSLKAFSNAPGELQKSYMKFGTTLFKKAGELALAVQTGGASTETIGLIQALVKQAQAVQERFQTEPNASAQVWLELKSLNEKTRIEIASLCEERETQDLVLREKARSDDGDKTKILAELSEHRLKTRDEIEKLVSRYKQQVELIEKASNAALLKSAQLTSK